ncbi:Mini-ribonuclease 3 [Pantanalinema rosaneae CENA516]|uniref:Mini-ribonuclease 3 n=1 Tax=Pantanalinema rosaneae TaxID=1620701 RepID=UPI003D6DAE84
MPDDVAPIALSERDQAMAQQEDASLPSLRSFEGFVSRSLPAVPLQQLSPAALAYLGDAVYELYIRQYYLVPPKRIQTYHNQVVAQVRAEQQAIHLRSLLPHLTTTELDILRRGRNAATGKPKRVDSETYQQATSLETLIGYLYLTDPQRLMVLLTQLELNADLV